MYGMFLLKI